MQVATVRGCQGLRRRGATMAGAFDGGGCGSIIGGGAEASTAVVQKCRRWQCISRSKSSELLLLIMYLPQVYHMKWGLLSSTCEFWNVDTEADLLLVT
ncbi:hypothetical protein DM860_001011 [Cuscuta australis]|uniref:Uncharacterized protein n=1 Tax=Cuscuta australis TaxID=267555 RepID=A0A328DWY3_9ASTE|nr:hypothetical protein DM860_001011 [Cuscuta australis]